jgi:eukaryotic-like serine/threonine-protein kinase
MVGESLGPYRIEEKLGEGGMGVVYRARATRLDRTVAIKVLRPDAVSNTERRKRFVQEAKSASALNHTNIITVYDIGTDGGADYIAMEYVAGQSLDRLIDRRSLPVRHALRYAIPVAEALAAAHESGIIHRDVKPGNVMVTEKGQVKLVDFGLAKLTEGTVADMDASTETRGPQTEEGATSAPSPTCPPSKPGRNRSTRAATCSRSAS